LKAATSLVSGPSLVLIQAGGSVGLPEASRGLKERGWPGLRRVERVVTAAGLMSMGSIGLIVVCFGKRLLEFLYGHQFGRFAGVADILALSFFVATAGLGAILSLKTTKQTNLLFHVSVVSLIVSVIAVAVLAPTLGLRGAALATLVTNSVTTFLLLMTHHRHSHKAAEAIFASAASADDAVVVVTVLAPNELEMDSVP
jgi:O-antigen/teichoic acid export membrane protein